MKTEEKKVGRRMKRKEKEELVRKLYEQGYTYREIAKELRISVRDISRILREEERKDEIKEIKEELERLRESVDYLYEFLDMISEIGTYYMKKCKYYDGTFCNRWYWKSKPVHLINKHKLEAKEVNGKWYLEATPEFCLGCRGYEPKEE
ncbi:hypothetical protein DRO21_05245 [archaeon]|nr:MAG: hypothetical protein DRO21_05245 [archaeon]